MKVAAVQFAPAFKDVESNLRAAALMVVAAAEAGARIVVLPELCTTGFSFMSAEEAAPYAETIEEGSRSMRVMSALAKKYNTAIAWGLLERDVGTGDLYNSQAMVLPDGRFLSYRKINRWGNDYLWACEGTGNPPVIDYEGKKVGLLICRDVRDKAPAWKDFYEPGDADIVCFSSNWGDGGFPSVNWVEFAKDNMTWLVVANRYGQEANNDFGEGGACVIEPSTKVHCDGLVWSRPCVVLADIP
jgi:predicted amidohydrolase